MTGLIVLLALWVVLLTGVWVHPKLSRKAKIIALVPIVAYGVVSGVRVARSYAAGRPQFSRMAQKWTVAEEHLASVLGSVPDSALAKPLVQSAKQLHADLKRTMRFGVWSWGVRYRYGVVPEVNGDVVAANLERLLDVPAQLAYAEAANVRNSRDFTQCYDYRLLVTRDFPMNYSRSAGVISMILDAYKSGATTSMGLCDTVNIARDDARDPRSPTYRLSATAAKLVGMQNKLDELLAVACGAFDEEIALAVRNVRPSDVTQGPEWKPLSPLFMDFTPLVPNLTGISTIEVRWMGDPPKPVVGTTEPIYKLDCETRGTWPAGQDIWRDSTGNSGPTYFVDASASRVFAKGVRLLKWDRQPDIRSLNIMANAEDRRYAGIPTVDVTEDLFLPPPDRSKRR